MPPTYPQPALPPPAPTPVERKPEPVRADDAGPWQRPHQMAHRFDVTTRTISKALTALDLRGHATMCRKYESIDRRGLKHEGFEYSAAAADMIAEWIRANIKTSPPTPTPSTGSPPAAAHASIGVTSTEARVSAGLDYLVQYPDASSIEIESYLKSRFGMAVDTWTVNEMRRTAGQSMKKHVPGSHHRLPDRYRAVSAYFRQNPDAPYYLVFQHLRVLGHYPGVTKETLDRLRADTMGPARARRKRSGNGAQLPLVAGRA
jgi:hypothetical protein